MSLNIEPQPLKEEVDTPLSVRGLTDPTDPSAIVKDLTKDSVEVNATTSPSAICQVLIYKLVLCDDVAFVQSIVQVHSAMKDTDPSLELSSPYLGLIMDFKFDPKQSFTVNIKNFLGKTASSPRHLSTKELNEVRKFWSDPDGFAKANKLKNYKSVDSITDYVAMFDDSQEKRKTNRKDKKSKPEPPKVDKPAQPKPQEAPRSGGSGNPPNDDGVGDFISGLFVKNDMELLDDARRLSHQGFNARLTRQKGVETLSIETCAELATLVSNVGTKLSKVADYEVKFQGGLVKIALLFNKGLLKKEKEENPGLKSDDLTLGRIAIAFAREAYVFQILTNIGGNQFPDSVKKSQEYLFKPCVTGIKYSERGKSFFNEYHGFLGDLYKTVKVAKLTAELNSATEEIANLARVKLDRMEEKDKQILEIQMRTGFAFSEDKFGKFIKYLEKNGDDKYFEIVKTEVEAIESFQDELRINFDLKNI